MSLQSDAESRLPLPVAEGNVGPVELVLLTRETEKYEVTYSGIKKEINNDPAFSSKIIIHAWLPRINYRGFGSLHDRNGFIFYERGYARGMWYDRD